MAAAEHEGAGAVEAVGDVEPLRCVAAAESGSAASRIANATRAARAAGCGLPAGGVAVRAGRSGHRPDRACYGDHDDRQGGEWNEQDRRCGNGGDRQPRQVRRQPPGHHPDGLRHDGERRELQPVQRALRQRSLPEAGAKRKGVEQDHRGQGEGDPGGEGARDTRAVVADGDADLTGGWAGQELAERHEISVVRLAQPFAANHEGVAEIPNVRHRASEAGETEEEERPENLGGVGERRSGRGSVLGHADGVPEASVAVNSCDQHGAC